LWIKVEPIDSYFTYLPYILTCKINCIVREIINFISKAFQMIVHLTLMKMRDHSGVASFVLNLIGSPSEGDGAAATKLCADSAQSSKEGKKGGPQR
jgi:hypothetical protein